MATRRSVTGGGLTAATQTILQSVMRADDIERAQAQTDIENTRADLQIDQQQQQIDLAERGELRLQQQGEFTQATQLLDRMGSETVSMRDAASLFPVFGEAIRGTGLDLAGEFGDLTFNPHTMQTLQIEGIQGAIAAGLAPGASREEVRQGQVASNMVRFGQAGDDEQVEGARTSAFLQAQVQTQTAQAMLDAEEREPGLFAELNGALRSPYTSPLSGITVNTTAGLKILADMDRMTMSASQSSGSAFDSRVSQLTDMYNERRPDIDPALIESTLRFSLGGGFAGEGGPAKFAALRAQYDTPAAQEFFTSMVTGNLAAQAFAADDPWGMAMEVQEVFGEDTASRDAFFSIIAAGQPAGAAVPGAVQNDNSMDFTGESSMGVTNNPQQALNPRDPAVLANARSAIEEGSQTLQQVRSQSPELAEQMENEIRAGVLVPNEPIMPNDGGETIRRFFNSDQTGESLAQQIQVQTGMSLANARAMRREIATLRETDRVVHEGATSTAERRRSEDAARLAGQNINAILARAHQDTERETILDERVDRRDRMDVGR